MKTKEKLSLSMHAIIKATLVLVFLLINTIGFSQTVIFTGPYDATSWNNLLSQVNAKKITLDNLIVQAQNDHLEVSYAIGSKLTVNDFVNYATWDYNNYAALDVFYKGIIGHYNAAKTQLQTYGVASPADPTRVAPFQELHDCIKVLDNAIGELNNQINKSIKLSSPPNFITEAPNVKLDGAFYKINNNSRVVFPSTLWGMPANANLMNSVGFQGSTFYSPAQTQSPDGSITVSYATNTANTMATNSSLGQVPQQIHLTHTNLPSWMTTAKPGIEDFSRAFVHYDIDYPGLSIYNQNMMVPFIAATVNKAGTTPMVHVMANEPHWDLVTGAPDASTGVSEYTYLKFESFLQSKYGTIANLNVVYAPFNGNVNFANWTSVRARYKCPLVETITKRGEPAWYDWCRFNMDRVNVWTQSLKSYVRQSDPISPVSVKFLGKQFQDGKRDDGIDLEWQYDLQEMMGADFQVVPNETFRINSARYSDWKNRYIIDWREQSIGLDFAKSLYPNKPFFDSEWHGLSSNAWGNIELPRGYIRSALWMGFSHGLSMINNWWWNRNYSAPDFSFKSNSTTSGVVGTALTQPVAYDDYGRTMKELNAHGNSLASLIPSNREFLIYYCVESAIQDANYASQMADLYEALKLNHANVGFTTPSKIAALGYTPKAIIIPASVCISNLSLDAIRTYKMTHSAVDILKINRFSGDQTFLKNELGQIISPVRDVSFTSKSINFNSDILTLKELLSTNLTIPKPLIDFNEKDSEGVAAVGVISSQGYDSDSAPIELLINLGKTDRVLSFTGNPTNLFDLITQQPITSTTTMKPYDVLLVRKGSLLSNNTKVFDSFKMLVFPNPVNDIIYIENEYIGSYFIYSGLGAVIKKVVSDKKSLSIPMNGFSSGVYFLKFISIEGKIAVKTLIVK